MWGSLVTHRNPTNALTPPGVAEVRRSLERFSGAEGYAVSVVPNETPERRVTLGNELDSRITLKIDLNVGHALRMVQSRVV
jgi:hypothetical protein